MRVPTPCAEKDEVRITEHRPPLTVTRSNGSCATLIARPPGNHGAQVVANPSKNLSAGVSLKMDRGHEGIMKDLKCVVVGWLANAWIVGACLAPWPGEAAEERVFHGVNLSDLGEVKGYRGMPEIYELDPATRHYQMRDGSFHLQLDGAWIIYNPTLNTFYLNKVPGENEASYFGPIANDPFDLFKLEELYTSKLRNEYVVSPDVMYRLRLMVRSGDPKLRERALRIVTEVLAPEVSEKARAFNIGEFRKLVDGLKGEDVAPALAAVERTEKEIEEHRPVIPDDQYSPGNDALEKLGKLQEWMKPSVPVPGSAWGEPLNGLRAAAVFSSVTPEVGAKMDVWLMVENVSDHEIKFAVWDVIQNARAVVKREDGTDVKVSFSFATGLSPTYRHKLRPKERLTLAKKALAFDDGQGTENIGFGGSRAVAGAGKYRVRYESVLGSGHMAKGEWSERLSTGDTLITVGMKAAAARREP